MDPTWSSPFSSTPVSPHAAAKVPAVDVKRAIKAGSLEPITGAKKQRVEPDVRQADNAERDCHRMFIRMGLSLPLPIQEIVHETETGPIVSHCVRMTDYCAYFLKRAPFLLCGGTGKDIGYRLKTFWEAFRCHHPGHAVYEKHANELDKVIPYCFHGDEGKGPKRATFMDFSFETPLGLDMLDESFTPSSSQEISKDARFLVSAGEICDDMDPSHVCCARSMNHNASGHSYLKRYLLFGLPHAWYKEGKHHILHKHLELVTEEATSFFENGIMVDNQVYFGAFVGLKGDLKFHKEVTVGLTRCYANLGKKNLLKMCSFCWAGSANFPFEEVSECPAWTSTMYRDRPWTSDPFVAKIPFDSCAPEFSLKLDPFHIMKVGFSRDVVGSIILALCRLNYFDFDPAESQNVDERLKRACGAFKLWCAAERRCPGLRSFSRSFFNCKAAAQSPWANAKGSDVTLLLQWLNFHVPCILQTRDLEDPEHKPIFKVMHQ